MPEKRVFQAVQLPELFLPDAVVLILQRSDQNEHNFMA